jgi:hypothetical protein
MTVLIDGDIVAYRAAYSTEGGHADDVADKVDELMDYILDATTFDGSPFKVYLTGDGNFRYDVAVTVPYKGNRRDTKKPEFLPDARDYLVEDYGAVVSSGEEADDLIAIEATKLGPHTIIASVDKDFLQVPCVHYNTNKQTFTEQDELSATRFFRQANGTLSKFLRSLSSSSCSASLNSDFLRHAATVDRFTSSVRATFSPHLSGFHRSSTISCTACCCSSLNAISNSTMPDAEHETRHPNR